MDAELVVAAGKIAALEEKVRNQRTLLKKLSKRVDVMEGKLCHCGKGKEREALGEISPILGGPIVLGSSGEGHSSRESFYSTSEVLPSSSSSVKENEVVLYDSTMSRLVEIVEDPVENPTPIPVPAPTIDLEGIRHLAVCGQRAIRLAGCPKSVFHPYPRCCAIGSRLSTHGIGYPCSRLPADGDEPSFEGGAETQGWGYES